MGKIKISSSNSNIIINLPPEILLYINKMPVFDGRRIKIGSQSIALMNNIHYNRLVISNFYWSNLNKRNSFTYSSFSKKAIKSNNVVTYSHGSRITSKVLKNNKLTICDTYEVDYKIYEEGERYIILAYFKLGDVVSIPNNNVNSFYRKINDVFNEYGNYNFQNALNTSNNRDNFYHFVDLKSDNSVVYLTKDKFIHCVLTRNITGYNLNHNDQEELFKGHTRTISFSKLCEKLYPDHNPKILQAYLEYNKLISTYDKSLFKIVTGNDIIKYYHHTNYFKSTGDLGSSCMRYDNNVDAIKFYAENSNVSLIIAKLDGVDSIIGRALLWTTTSGDKVMDRIYTSDSKLVSLFHKYAEEKGFINVYNIRKPSEEKRVLTRMSPTNWKPDYEYNLIVNLDYLPMKIYDISDADKFRLSTSSRRLSTCDTLEFPYMDNFNLINFITKQASLLPVKNVFMCKLSNTPINVNNFLEHNGNIYNNDLVYVNFDDEVKLKNDDDNDMFSEEGEEESLEDIVYLTATVDLTETYSTVENDENN